MAKTVLAALAATCALVCPSYAAAPPTDGPTETDFAHAGISVVLPAGFELQTLSERFDILRAVKTEKDRRILTVSVSAYPVTEKDTADSCADGAMHDLEAAVAIKDMKLLSKSPTTIAGATGTARLLSYSFRGSATIAGQVYFIREVKKGKVRICYLLTVEAVAEQQNAMLQVFRDLMKGVKLTAVQHSSSLAVEDLGGAVEIIPLAFSIRVPEVWHWGQAPLGVQLARTDYLRGGIPNPVVDVIAADVPADANARDFARRCIQDYTKAAAAKNAAAKVLSEGPARLDGVEGYQFVFQETPSKPAPAIGEAEADPPELKVQRMICVPGGKDGRGRTDALILTVLGSDAKSAEAMMDKIASGFKVLQATTGPATGPATTPATGGATRASPAPASSAAPVSPAPPAGK